MNIQTQTDTNEDEGSGAKAQPDAGAQARRAATERNMIKAVAALSNLPVGVQAKADAYAARQALYDYMKADEGNKAAAYSKAVEQLRESISVALESQGLDAGTRQALEGMLDNIDSEIEMGDNKKTPKNLANYNFNRYLTKEKGPPPVDMVDPHAHHIVFKEGHGEAQKALVREAQELLRSYGIDPIFGLENLVWAPNRIVGQHHINPLRYVVEKLKAVKDFGGTYNDIVETLADLGEKAAKRR